AHPYKGRLRQIFPSADRAKSIVEVRVSILDPDEHVKPEMTASVTFQEPSGARPPSDTGPTGARPPSDTAVVLMPKTAVAERNGQRFVWVVTNGTANRRVVTLGPDRLDQVEVKNGVMAGEAVIVNAPATLTDHAVVRVKGS